VAACALALALVALVALSVAPASPQASEPRLRTDLGGWLANKAEPWIEALFPTSTADDTLELAPGGGSKSNLAPSCPTGKVTDAYHLNSEQGTCQQVCIGAGLRSVFIQHGGVLGGMCTKLGFTVFLAEGKRAGVRYYIFAPDPDDPVGVKDLHTKAKAAADPAQQPNPARAGDPVSATPTVRNTVAFGNALWLVAIGAGAAIVAMLLGAYFGAALATKSATAAAAGGSLELGGGRGGRGLMSPFGPRSATPSHSIYDGASVCSDLAEHGGGGGGGSGGSRTLSSYSAYEGGTLPAATRMGG
jgi:hypothetical protein